MKTNSHFAAIDIGTNSFHLIIVKIDKNGSFEVVDREKEVIRLGEGSGGDIKLINKSAMSRGLLALKRFKSIAETYNCEIRAVATSAVRESHNKTEFIDKAYKETGINVEVINGQEEARLIYLGVLKAVDVFNKKSLIIDIGGGSTEFLIGKKGISSFSVSMKLGAVRLTDKFFSKQKISKASINECKNWIDLELINVAKTIKGIGFDVCVGSSGTIMATALMIYALNNKSPYPIVLNNYDINKKDFDPIADEVLKRKSFDKLKKIPGLDVKRADIITAGILILQRIFELFDLKKLTVSGYALREGIIIDSLSKNKTSSIKPCLENIRKQSVNQLAEKCFYDKAHCEHISKLALQLFDGLTSVHKLDAIYREYLQAAAILHDIGYHISHTNHHHHSYYIIKNSELLGFTENEIDIIAHTARYHRKSHPKISHTEFQNLPSHTKQIIYKLAAILRVADSLDRTHSRNITSLSVKINSNGVELYLRKANKRKGDVELWNLDRRKNLFELVFEKKIIVNKEKAG